MSTGTYDFCALMANASAAVKAATPKYQQLCVKTPAPTPKAVQTTAPKPATPAPKPATPAPKPDPVSAATTFAPPPAAISVAQADQPGYISQCATGRCGSQYQDYGQQTQERANQLASGAPMSKLEQYASNLYSTMYDQQAAKAGQASHLAQLNTIASSPEYAANFRKAYAQTGDANSAAQMATAETAAGLGYQREFNNYTVEAVNAAVSPNDKQRAMAAISNTPWQGIDFGGIRTADSNTVIQQGFDGKGGVNILQGDNTYKNIPTTSLGTVYAYGGTSPNTVGKHLLNEQAQALNAAQQASTAQANNSIQSQQIKSNENIALGALGVQRSKVANDLAIAKLEAQKNSDIAKAKDAIEILKIQQRYDIEREKIIARAQKDAAHATNATPTAVKITGG